MFEQEIRYTQDLKCECGELLCIDRDIGNILHKSTPTTWTTYIFGKFKYDKDIVDNAISCGIGHLKCEKCGKKYTVGGKIYLREK